MDNALDGFHDNPVLNGACLFLIEGGCEQCHTINGAGDALGIDRATGILRPKPM